MRLLITFIIITFISNVACVNINQSQTSKTAYTNTCSTDGDCDNNEICSQSNFICKNTITGKVNPKHKKINISKNQNNFTVSGKTIFVVTFATIILITAIILGLNRKITHCCDGTTSSSSGSGTCSSHGGVC